MAISTVLSTGATGVSIFQDALRVTSNNIANTDTVGFKENDISFSELVAGGIAGPGKLQMAKFTVGRGAAVSSVRNLFEQGTPEQTSRNLDLHIDGEGFFVLKDPKGSTIPLFTRAGIFDDNNLGLVTNPDGFLLQGSPVTIDPVTGEKKIGKTDSINLADHNFPPKATTKANFMLNLFAADTASGNVVKGSEPINFDAIEAGAFSINGTGFGAIGGDNAVDRIAELILAINEVEDFTGVHAEKATDTTISLTNSKGGPITVTFDLGFDPDVAVKTGLTAGSFLAEGAKSLTGKVTSTIGTKIIDGEGTKFLNELLPGDALVIGTELFTVESIQSNTELTVTQNTTEDLFDVPAVAQAASFSNSVKFFDSLGAEHLVNLRYRKTATNTWEWNAVVDRKDNLNGAFDEVQATGKLGFTPAGQLDPATTTVASFPTGGFDFKGGAFVDQQIKFDFAGTTEKLRSGTTQFGTPTLSLLLEHGQDGFSSGSLQSITVDKEGFINGLYTNGKIQSLYQLAIAKFPNQEGLTRVGKNLYMQSDLSGEEIQSAPGSGGRGEIVANAFERSTVDLAEQFVKLITYQRGFQANSKVILTADEVVQEVVNLKR